METVKNSLSSAKNNDVVKKETKTIFDIIKGMKKQFEIASPKHINGERFVRISITTIRQNTKLLKCDKTSLLGALMVSAQFGLEPGILGQAYLIPYGNQVQFQIGYKGQIELLRRSAQLSDIYAYAVHENDKFEITLGIDRYIVHVPNFDNRGEEIGYYAVAKLKDGTAAFEYMTKKEVEAHRDKFSKSKNSGPWATDFAEMAKKTVIKKMFKYLPLSVELLEAASKDEKVHKLKEEAIESADFNVDDVIIEDIKEAVEVEGGEVINE